jgi:hypothetical protein
MAKPVLRLSTVASQRKIRKLSIVTKLNIPKILPTGPTISKNWNLKPKNKKNGSPFGFVSS